MALSNFSLPDIAGGDLDSQKERRRIMEYLYQLSEQLRFMMGNIGEENLSDELRGTIKDASCQVGELNRQLTDATGRMTSQIRQQADEIALKVSQSTYDSEKVIRSATAPENPTTHMLWLDISLSPNMLKRWTGSTWAIAGTNAVTASGVTIQDDNVTISTPNFNLEILDAFGDPVLTMSAGDAGFDKLYADKIVSDSTASMGPKKTVTYTFRRPI